MKCLLIISLFICLTAKSQDKKIEFHGSLTINGTDRIEGTECTTDSIGERYTQFQYTSIPQQGLFNYSKDHGRYGSEYYIFFNGYMVRQKYIYEGKTVDNQKYLKPIRYFKLKSI